MVFRIVQKELALLLLLALITIPLFIFTRSVAARNRSRTIQTGQLWFQRGQSDFQGGHVESAIDSFRNATTADHDNPAYTMALATALAADDHVEEARQALLRLRTASPENGEINLSLARLAAREDKTPEAIRYYHNALYGVWPADDLVDERMKVRTELVRFFMSVHDNSRALSELLILASDTPDKGPARNSVGLLFLEAGDSQHALEQFTRALRENSKDPAANLGAGRASFDLADYSRSRRYLEVAVANGATASEAATLLETVKLILARDPLGSGLGTDERIRRLTANLDDARGELEQCVVAKQDDANSAVVLKPLLAELAEGVDGEFQPKELRADPEGFRTGLNLIGRIETATGQICGESSPLHRALLLIAKKRGGAEQ